MSITLVDAYDQLSEITRKLKSMEIGTVLAQQLISNLSEKVNRTLPGVVLKVPTITELQALVPASDPEYPEYESSPEYEESYESSACSF